MSDTTKEKVPLFSHLWDYIKRNIFITFGTGGIILGVLIMTYPKGSFHEIEYEPRVLLGNLLKQNDTLYKNGKEHDVVLDSEIKYRLKITSQVNDSLLDAQLVHNQLFFNKDSFKIDSLFIDFKAIDESNEDSVLFYWDYYITTSVKDNKPIGPYHLTGKLYSTKTVFKQSIKFFTEYPGFALWTFLIILQFGLFSFLIMFTVREIQLFNKVYKHHLDNWAIFKKTAAAFMVIMVFAVMGYLAFFTNSILSNGLFYNYIGIKLSVITLIIIVLGSISAAGFNIVKDLKFNVV